MCIFFADLYFKLIVKQKQQDYAEGDEECNDGREDEPTGKDDENDALDLYIKERNSEHISTKGDYDEIIGYLRDPWLTERSLAN